MGCGNRRAMVADQFVAIQAINSWVASAAVNHDQMLFGWCSMWLKCMLGELCVVSCDDDYDYGYGDDDGNNDDDGDDEKDDDDDCDFFALRNKN